LKVSLKRVFDLAVVVLTAPLWVGAYALAALMVRVTLGSPVYFCQQRPGQHTRPFYILKFRTMTVPGDGQSSPLTDAQRLTRWGRFLRSTSLDELPELFNVLKGDMSLVGPRPLLMEYLPLYTPEQARRHEVRPGITGWAQVNGRNAISWEKKFELDAWYVDNQCFWLDLKILALTFRKVLKQEAVSAVDHVTMPKFTGSSPLEQVPP
jgi:lipopolysaccharide/colanic/teichoic acid biosynthesis glycosyltransferase